MPLVEIEIHVRVDGHSVGPFPIYRSLVVAQPVTATVTKTGADGASYVLLPTVSAFSALSVLLVKPDQTMGFTLNGSTGANFTLNPGGIFLMLDGVINSGASTNLLVNNNSGITANVLYLAASTT